MQFKSFKRFAAVAMAAILCVPAFSTQVLADEIKTDFGVYAPVLTINVPANASIKVNSIAASGSTDVDSVLCNRPEIKCCCHCFDSA